MNYVVNVYNVEIEFTFILIEMVVSMVVEQYKEYNVQYSAR